METFRIKAVEELEGVAAWVVAVAAARPRECAIVVALHGDLGAGKTTFTQTLARTLGVTESVTSPTFVIMKGYATLSPEFDNLLHIDAYRIEKSEELSVLGFAQILAAARTLVVIEWAEKVVDVLPPQVINLTFTIEGEYRVITLS
jgi:tRNA threonylcarbamoyladenosine biosynthesis protein TsaE